MPEFFGLPITEVGATSLMVLTVLLVLTDKLVWHTRLRHLEKDRDRWQGIALQLLGVTEKLTVQAEVTNAVMQRLPDPAKDGEDA